MANDTRPPGEYIREELKSRGWTQEDLARVLERPLPTVNEIIQGKRAIMPEMAFALGSAFGQSPEVWMEREYKFRLSLVQGDGVDVARRAKIYEIAPVREMQRRGWIQKTDSLEDLEKEVLSFYEIPSVDAEPQRTAVMRKSSPTTALTPHQKAWCFRVKHIAKSILVNTYDESRLDQCEKELRKIAAHSQEVRKVPTLFAKYGIRFVIVEPLSGGKVDGMATWLDEKSPVIGMSIRFDRIDAFWFTLGHEWSHIRNRDELSIDSDVNGYEELPWDGKPEYECRADRESAAMLIPPEELDSFILRVGPLYSKDRINQFANRIKIHPGIIVGQLQHKGEIGYSANREMLVKVRNTVTSVAFTDGWGNTIDPKGNS